MATINAIDGDGREVPVWDGVCVACGHDYVGSCHGDCTCLSCNGQRQDEERVNRLYAEDGDYLGSALAGVIAGCGCVEILEAPGAYEDGWDMIESVAYTRSHSCYCCRLAAVDTIIDRVYAQMGRFTDALES